MMMKSFGAMNVSTFRENVRSGKVPTKDSISFEGLFSQYFFDTGTKETSELVHSTYTISQCRNEMTNTVERYISIGLNSSEDGKNVRKDLNVILVLDISGSMGDYFDFRKSGEGYTKNSKEKMEIAKDVLKEIIKELKENEGFGVVLFDDRTEVLQPLRKKKNIDLEELNESINEIRSRGGTNMEIGMKTAVEMFEDMIDNNEEFQNMNNRIIFLTDAQPTSFIGGKNSLINLAKRALKRKIYTSFIGVGLDFNTKLVHEISKVRGSNYFSVHSQREFKRILNEDFNYMVTPLVFDCILFLESDAFEIEKCYGTPLADESNGVIMRIDSLSASAKKSSGETKGGIVLIKLKEKLTSTLNPKQDIKITLRYEKPNTEKVQTVYSFNFKEKMDELITKFKIYENSGIRKAILLAKFGTIIREVLENARKNNGSIPFEEIKRLKKFKNFFQDEAKIIKDKNLLKEVDVLDRLIYQK